MAEYYLLSQLPSLDGINDNAPMPVTEERFLELCDRFLSKKAKKIVNNITLMPPARSEKSGSVLVDAWNEGERNLRFALGKVRGEKMKKPFHTASSSFPVGIIKAVNTAAEMDSPLEAERFLNHYRLDFLEALRPMDNFSEEFVYYYCLKLKLIMRMRKFDVKSGEAAYRNIYDSILNGERTEAIQ